MSLHYLSGDEISGKKKSGSKGSGSGSKKSGSKKVKKSKAEKKQARKRVFKKVAKVGLAPARASFLLVTSVNGLRLAKLMAKVWRMPNGKETLTKFWSGFGGDINKLKQAIIKGSKQQISGDQIGSAVATAVATATPIIVALAPILKAFKAHGSDKEAKEFDQGVEKGRADLNNDPDTEKSNVSMPKNKEVGIVTDKDGNAQESSKIPDDKKMDIRSGGSGDDGSGDTGSRPSGSGGSGGSGSSDEELKKEAQTKMGSNFSPLGFYSMILMYLMMFVKTPNLLTEILSSISLMMMILIIPATSNQKYLFNRIAKKIVMDPFNFIQSKIYSYGRK